MTFTDEMLEDFRGLYMEPAPFVALALWLKEIEFCKGMTPYELLDIAVKIWQVNEARALQCFFNTDYKGEFANALIEAIYKAGR